MSTLLKVLDVNKAGIFAADVLFGTAGVKIFSRKDAKEKFVKWTAAALRAKDCVMNTAATIQENAEDILAEAKQVNEDRAAEEAALEELGEVEEAVSES